MNLNSFLLTLSPHPNILFIKSIIVHLDLIQAHNMWCEIYINPHSLSSSHIPSNMCATCAYLSHVTTYPPVIPTFWAPSSFYSLCSGHPNSFIAPHGSLESVDCRASISFAVTIPNSPCFWASLGTCSEYCLCISACCCICSLEVCPVAHSSLFLLFSLLLLPVPLSQKYHASWLVHSLYDLISFRLSSPHPSVLAHPSCTLSAYSLTHTESHWTPTPW